MKTLILFVLLLSACATAKEPTIAVSSAPKQQVVMPKGVAKMKPFIVDCRDVSLYDSSKAKTYIKVLRQDLKYELDGRNDWIVGGKDARIADLTQEIERQDSVRRCHPDQ